MTYFAGIDGGQSSTTAAVADETGRILGRGSAGPADEIGQTRESTRLRDALAAALHDAIAKAGLPTDTQFAAIVAGVSGYEGRVYGAAPQLPSQNMLLVHDTENAHAGALAGEAGTIAIAGTGSVAFARSERGVTALLGGWGFLFGDEGSGFWLAREALSAAMRDRDAGEDNELGALALAYFNKPALRAIARAFYAGEISRAELAGFSGAIVHAAERGNGAAMQSVRSGAHALAALAKQAMHQAGMTRGKIAVTGGMMHSSTYSGEVAAALRDALPQCERMRPRYDPAVGSLILAYKRAGVAVPESIA